MNTEHLQHQLAIREGELDTFDLIFGERHMIIMRIISQKSLKS